MMFLVCFPNAFWVVLCTCNVLEDCHPFWGPFNFSGNMCELVPTAGMPSSWSSQGQPAFDRSEGSEKVVLVAGVRLCYEVTGIMHIGLDGNHDENRYLYI